MTSSQHSTPSQPQPLVIDLSVPPGIVVTLLLNGKKVATTSAAPARKN